MNHQYLIIKNTNILSEKKAVEELIKLLGILNIKYTDEIEIPYGKTTKKYNTTDLIQELKTNGYIKDLHLLIDQKNSLYVPTFKFAMTMKNASFKTNFAGIEQKLTGPGSVIPVELGITEDILFYRETACNSSSENDFNYTRRAYRAYLFSCIALIDAFIQKSILLISPKHPIEELIIERIKEKRVSLEEKLKLLFVLYTKKDAQLLVSTNEWCIFKKLKNIRNNITHSNEPYNIYEISKMAEVFNYVIDGVGGLLDLFFQHAALESLLYVKKLKFAKPIEYSTR